MFKTAYLTTVWFPCQATWLALKSMSPHESFHLQFLSMTLPLSIAHAHMTRISTNVLPDTATPVPISTLSLPLLLLYFSGQGLCLFAYWFA